MAEHIECEVLTLLQLYHMSHSPIKVMSGYNGKVLCNRFDEKKHQHLAEREVIAVWAEIVATKAIAYDNIARPQLCVYLHGKEEAANGKV